jgi:hypothetical protein
MTISEHLQIYVFIICIISALYLLLYRCICVSSERFTALYSTARSVRRLLRCLSTFCMARKTAHFVKFLSATRYSLVFPGTVHAFVDNELCCDIIKGDIGLHPVCCRSKSNKIARAASRCWALLSKRRKSSLIVGNPQPFMITSSNQDLLQGPPITENKTLNA